MLSPHTRIVVKNSPQINESTKMENLVENTSSEPQHIVDLADAGGFFVTHPKNDGFYYKPLFVQTQFSNRRPGLAFSVLLVEKFARQTEGNTEVRTRFEVSRIPTYRFVKEFVLEMHVEREIKEFQAMYADLAKRERAIAEDSDEALREETARRNAPQRVLVMPQDAA